MTDNTEDIVTTGRKLYLSGRLPEALECFQAAMDKNPFDVEARGWWGKVAGKLGRTEEAIKQIKTALEVQPSYIHNYLHLATVYRDLKKNEIAIEVIASGLNAMTTDYTRYWLEGVYEHVRGKRQAAIAALYRAYEIYRDGYSVTSLLGELLVYVGDYERGREILNVVLTLEWVPPSTFLYLAIAETELGNDDAALRMLIKGADADPGNQDIERMLDQQLQRRGITRSVLKHFRQVLELEKEEMQNAVEEPQES